MMKIFESVKDEMEMMNLLEMDRQMSSVADCDMEYWPSEEKVKAMLDGFTLEELIMIYLRGVDEPFNTSANLLLEAEKLGAKERELYLQLTEKLITTVSEDDYDAFYGAIKSRILRDARTFAIVLDIVQNGNLCPMAGPVGRGVDWNY